MEADYDFISDLRFAHFQKGNLERFREDIARLDDDIIKAAEYMEETESDLNRLTEDYNVVEMELKTVAESVREERARLGELEELTKAQEAGSGLRSSEVRELTVEHDQSRAVRQRRRDREEWEKALIAEEADLARLENEKEVLEDKHHEIDSLKREIERQKAENQLQLSDIVLSRFQLIVSDLDLMKEMREWMMRTMRQFCDLGHQIDEGFNED
ncbi:hypothetical protein KIN20_035086 [Parelaphostrongylus tenuis]|uniref:Uncharacterized protein n=1 Tax=Parelaphostrongylus tenuis TaxID=148309 RepID=A0AAD5WJF4_PARTN|nr:hypothetical protein KIN20_035086 [Parelaphostrongylus tenuis]